MAVVYDTQNVTATASAANNLSTASFAISSGSDRALVVKVSTSASGGALKPSNVKWGGSGGTAVGTALTAAWYSSSTGCISGWVLAPPAAQSSTVYVSWAGNQDEQEVFALVYTGVNQTTPVRAPAFASGAGASPRTATVNATTVADDVVVDVVGVIDGGGTSPTLAVGASQASRKEYEGGAPSTYIASGVSEETATGVAVTMSWTVTFTSGSADWAIGAVPLIPAGAATVYQYARPSSDVTIGAWTPSTGATLWETVDETASTVGDYMSSLTASGATATWAEVGFSAWESSPSTHDSHEVRVLARSVTGQTLTVILRNSGGTAVATGVFTALSATWTTYSLPLTSAQAEALDDSGFKTFLKTT